MLIYALSSHKQHFTTWISSQDHQNPRPSGNSESTLKCFFTSCWSMRISKSLSAKIFSALVCLYTVVHIWNVIYFINCILLYIIFHSLRGKKNNLDCNVRVEWNWFNFICIFLFALGIEVKNPLWAVQLIKSNTTACIAISIYDVMNNNNNLYLYCTTVFCSTLQ